jgi:hypothetical protein
MKAFSAGFYKKIPKNPVICKIRATILYIYNHFHLCLIKPALFRLVISLLFDVYFSHYHSLVSNVIFALLSPYFSIVILRSVPYILFPMLYVLLPMFYTLFPIFFCVILYSLSLCYILFRYVISFFVMLYCFFC